MDKDEIKAALDEAGIDYDARLSAENLAELLPVRIADKTLMRVERDYWPTDDDRAAGWPVTQRNRVVAGTLVEVTTEAAMNGMEAGLLSRVKV